jgi:hypothetical protein
VPEHDLHYREIWIIICRNIGIGRLGQADGVHLVDARLNLENRLDGVE